MAQSTRQGRLLVISGPSGAGKGTLIGKVLPRLANAVLSKSATTRPMRPDEQQGREYHFLTPDEFENRVREGDFIEHVKYGSNRYGTLKSEVTGNLDAGRDVVLEIELEGARRVRRLIPGAVLIFIAPPDFAELERRLTARNTETPTVIAARLERAREELAAQKEFDYIIVNDNVGKAADELERAIRSALREEQT
ncbi:MAG: guanylate kinase [Thermoleophilia bacterium]